MELDALHGTLSKVESKSIKAAKDCSTVESQLKDTQVKLGHALLCTIHTRLSLEVAEWLYCWSQVVSACPNINDELITGVVGKNKTILNWFILFSYVVRPCWRRRPDRSLRSLLVFGKWRMNRTTWKRCWRRKRRARKMLRSSCTLLKLRCVYVCALESVDTFWWMIMLALEQFVFERTFLFHLDF